MGKVQFLFCRACKLTHSEEGTLLIESAALNTAYNPIKIAREAISKSFPQHEGVAAVATEALLITSLQEAYLAGLKDGILLAYSKDVGDGEPRGIKNGIVPSTPNRPG